MDLQSIASVTRRGTRISPSEWQLFTTHMKDLCEQLLEPEGVAKPLETPTTSNELHVLTENDESASNCFTPIIESKGEVMPPTHTEKRMLSLDLRTPENQKLPTLITPMAPKRLKLYTLSSQNKEEENLEYANTRCDDIRCKTYNAVNNDCFHLGQISFLKCCKCNPDDYNNW